MRNIPRLLGLSIAVVAISAPAHAQNYLWCAFYSGRGFGGSCQLNTMYVPPPGPHRRSRAQPYPY